VARLSKKNEELLKAVHKQAVRQQGTGITQAAQSTKVDLGTKEGEPAAKDQNAHAPTALTPHNPSAERASTSDSISSPHTDNSTVGVGVDLVEIERMERAIQRTPRILERVFTSGEREYAWNKARPAVQYATFFAAREAVAKALGCGFSGIGFQDIEITHDDKGKPNVLLHNQAARIAHEQGIVEIQISLSHTHQMAVASAVAIKAQSSPRRNEAISPMEELARQFKELRSLLDNLGVSTDEDEASATEGEESSAIADGAYVMGDEDNESDDQEHKSE